MSIICWSVSILYLTVLYNMLQQDYDQAYALHPYWCWRCPHFCRWFVLGFIMLCNFSLQVWDYQMINHCKGKIQIPLKEIIHQHHMHSTFPLQRVKHGELEVEFRWLGILEK